MDEAADKLEGVNAQEQALELWNDIKGALIQVGRVNTHGGGALE